MSLKKPNKALLGVLVIGGILGGGYAAWDSTIKHEFIPRNFGVIVEGQAYRSGRLTPSAMRKVVEEHGIKTILDLGAFIEGSPKDLEQQRVADELGVVRFRMPNLIGDGTGNPNEFAHAVRMINDPRAWPVLVHCGAGAQRTGATVVLHRCLIEGMTVEEAYPEAFNFGHTPRTDWEMLAFVGSHDEEIARSLATGEPIPGYEPTPYPFGEVPILSLAERRKAKVAGQIAAQPATSEQPQADAPDPGA